MKKLIALLTSILIVLNGCSLSGNNYQKYTYEFYDTFDTMIQFMGYAENEEQFEKLSKKGHTRFMELHKLYDIYNSYDGINNIKTINDNAGIKPIEVSQEIIDIIQFSKDWNKKTGGTVNIAMGPVLSIWHDYRENGINNPQEAKLPSNDLLKKASLNTDISKVEIDTVKHTVFLKDAGMRLDIGAIAKGYATEIVANELQKDGLSSLIINSGGNIRVIGQPKDSTRSKWGIGIQDPNGKTGLQDNSYLDVVFMNDSSLVTSGDYQRYYIVNGKKYHHLISPITLMPTDYYRSVTIKTKDSGLADFMSTTAFLLPYVESRKIIESMGMDAVWVMPDGTIHTTDNIKKSMQKLGGATSK